jgi:hypothetical protein
VNERGSPEELLEDKCENLHAKKQREINMKYIRSRA